jgi:hypothetical protein
MATTAIKLKIAKTKPAPHKILLVEYRCVHFWNSSTTSAFQTAILPLFGGIFLGAKSTRAKKPFLCHFFTAVTVNGSAVFARAFRPAKMKPALIRIASAYNRFIAGICRSAADTLGCRVASVSELPVAPSERRVPFSASDGEKVAEGRMRRLSPTSFPEPFPCLSAIPAWC